MQLTTYIAALATLALGATAQPGLGQVVGITLYSDPNCQNQVNAISVGSESCSSPSPGFSSMKINKLPEQGYGGGTLTAYTKNDCGCPTCGSDGYHDEDTGCLKDFGFVANALGWG